MRISRTNYWSPHNDSGGCPPRPSPQPSWKTYAKIAIGTALAGIVFATGCTTPRAYQHNSLEARIDSAQTDTTSREHRYEEYLQHHKLLEPHEFPYAIDSVQEF